MKGLDPRIRGKEGVDHRVLRFSQPLKDKIDGKKDDGVSRGWGELGLMKSSQFHPPKKGCGEVVPRSCE
jgi:hypothetical protein